MNIKHVNKATISALDLTSPEQVDEAISFLLSHRSGEYPSVSSQKKMEAIRAIKALCYKTSLSEAKALFNVMSDMTLNEQILHMATFPGNPEITQTQKIQWARRVVFCIQGTILLA